MLSLFVTDLHGHEYRYVHLFNKIKEYKPSAVFVGGDILPPGMVLGSAPDGFHIDFVNDFLKKECEKLREIMGDNYPKIYIILGNDDPRSEELALLDAGRGGLWHYAHGRSFVHDDLLIFGYAFVPPTPFMLKDWERYDVSRFVDVGCVPPEEGCRSVPVKRDEITYSTISKDLKLLTEGKDLSKSIFLFHSPPYKTCLDRAALDGMMIDHCPLDVHVGSIAIKRFIEEQQPMITLHGHIHEAARITGKWQEQMGRTYCYSAAIETPHTAIVIFDTDNPEKAERLVF